jgi:hypothetical protein
MPIDPNIALSFKPSVALEDPMQQYGRMQQIQANTMAMRQARNENALAARKLQGEAAVGKAYQDYFAPQQPGGAAPNPDSVARALAAAGRPDLIPAALEAINKNIEQRGKAQKAGTEAISTRLELRRQRLANVNDKAGLKAWSAENHRDEVLGPWLTSMGDFEPQSLATIDALGDDPASIARFKQEAALGVQKFIEQNKPQFYERNLGDTSVITSVPGLGGPAAQVPGSKLNISTPDQIVTPASGGMFRVNPRGGGFEEVTQGGGIPSARAPAPAGVPAAPAGAPAAGVPSIVANNNPGALEYRPWMKKYGGEPSADGRFAAFPSPQQGAAAQEALLRLDYIGKGVNTIDKIVDKYLGTGAENTPEQRANYKATLVQQLGIPANAQLQPGVVPKLAAAMRGFETGMGANAPGAPSGAPAKATAAPQANSTEGMTVEQVTARKSAKKLLDTMGWDPATGKDRVRELIKASPSGVVDTAANWFKGQQSKEGTAATNAAAALKSIASIMTLELAGGKLGASFSNEDRAMIEKQTGDIANTLLPVGDRLAAYDELQRLLSSRLGIQYSTPSFGGGAGEGKPAAPTNQAQGGATPPISALQKGRNTTFSNGQVWSLDKQGKPVRIN